MASRVKWSADVPELTAAAWGTPMVSANAVSKVSTRSPWAIYPEAITSLTAAASPSPSVGLEWGIYSSFSGIVQNCSVVGSGFRVPS